MSKVVYQEPFLSHTEQIELLKNRGLSFKDESKALNLLERVSYCRLSSYFTPFFKDTQNKVFKEDTFFDDIFEVYKFDMEFRKLITAEIEKIEIAVRSKIAHILSLFKGSFWIEDEKLFSKLNEHTLLMVKIKDEVKRSDESFIISFKKQYSNDIPPAFMTLEITSFGTLSKLFRNLKANKNKREIAQFFGLSDSVFESWLYSLVYVRNVCAHHARLWNRKIRIIPSAIKTNTNQWLINNQVPNNRMYFILSMIIYLLNIINPKHSFKQNLNNLFKKYPNIDRAAMGFPDDWQKEPLWKRSGIL